MKKITTLIFVLAFLNSCTTIKINDLVRDELNGAVKSVKTTANIVAAKEEEQSKFLVEEYVEYNIDGNRIEWTLHDVWKKENSRNTFIYDENGNLTERNLDITVTIIYDVNEEIGEKADTLIETYRKRFDYSYDEKGNRVQERAYDRFGRLDKKETYTYNRKRKLIRAEDIWEGFDSYAYNRKGKLIEERASNADGSYVMRTTYKYDNKGYRIEQEVYNFDGSLLSKDIYTNDEKGNLIERTGYDRKGELSRRNIFTYDDKGNWIEEKEYKKRIEYKEPQNTYEVKIFRVIKRKIEYY